MAPGLLATCLVFADADQIVNFLDDSVPFPPMIQIILHFPPRLVVALRYGSDRLGNVGADGV